MTPSLLELGRRGEPLCACDVFDMHGHLGRYGFAIPDLDPAALVAHLDRLGVSGIVCSHMQTMATEVGRGNDEVLAAMRAFPGRILGYVTLFPSSPEAVCQEVERRLGEGFLGIKLHHGNGHPYTHPAYAPAFAAANARHLPVLLHTWGEPADFEEVEALASRWPDAMLLLAHAIGVSGAVAPYTDLVKRHANVYLDTAMSRSPRGLLERYVAEAGADRIVYGSDALYYSAAPQLGKVLGARISDDAKRAILGGNARRILGRIE